MSAPTGPDADAAADRRLDITLRHSLRTVVTALLAVAVVAGAGEDAPALGAVQPAVVMVLAIVLGGLFLAGERARGGRARALTCALVAVWLVATLVSGAFSWLMLPVALVVLHALPWRAGLPVVLGLAAVSAWRLHAWVGPFLGALVAVAAAAVFVQLRRDADRHRALVARLREAEGSLAATERERGILAERERLARELHDTVAQQLASIVMLARTADPADAADSLALVESTARDGLAQTRRLVRDLASPGEVSLDAALRALVDDTRARAAASGRPLDIALTVDGTPRTLSPEVVQALQRGAQASVANVVQHAGAGRCVVGLGWFDDRVVLDVVDDGRGFDPADVGGDSFGIRGLRARLAQVGGTLAIDSTPGEGTAVALTVPLPDPHAEARPDPDPEPGPESVTRPATSPASRPKEAR